MHVTNFPDSLSLIIPLYNEEQRFVEHLKLLEKLHNQNKGWEIIFINDGSKDKTSRVVTEKIKPFKRMRLVSYTKNHGKGYAIKRGVNVAKNELILFSDIDFSTPITELELCMPFIKKGADIVIGTRKVHGATVAQHQPHLREWLGKQFTKLSNTILCLDISDFTCGFKLFKKDVAKKLFSNVRIECWGFDSEILYLANKFNYKVVEVPILWQNDPRTKVNLVKDIFKSFSDLITIRLNDFQGKYSK